jgi:hypothetical protein
MMAAIPARLIIILAFAPCTVRPALMDTTGAICMRSIFPQLAVKYLPMSDPSLSERDACIKLTTPAVERAGWDIQSQVRGEFSLTAGRGMARGQLVARGGIVRSRAKRYWSRERMTHVQRLAVLAGVLLYSACSILNQPVNPDGQSSQTGGVKARAGNGGTGGVVGTGRSASGGAGGSTGGSEATQECASALASVRGSCPTRSLLVPCLSVDAHCGLDDCRSWGNACAECLFGPCCLQYAAWLPTCSRDSWCSFGADWDAWRQCALSNCATVCNN